MQEEEKSNKKSIKERLFARATRAENFASRRSPNHGTKNRVVIASNVKTRKKPQIFQQNIQFDFLQYVRIVFKWATENNNIGRRDLELMLYLNPIGIFGKSDFDLFHRTIGLYQSKALQRYIDEGWIVVWRSNKGTREKALYTLSNKAKVLCNRVHKMCLGEEEIPTSVRNVLVTDKTKVINKYYLNVIKQMNKKTKARTQE